MPNPLHALAELLATLHDDQGRVTLPGFYDTVRPLSDRERDLMGRVPFDEQAWLAGPAASRATDGEAGFSTLERTGARPTAEVNGMWGGYTGPGHKTIIPAEAHAKMTFRLVADQRPEDVGARCGPGWRRTCPRGSRPRCTPRPAASRRAPATSTPRRWTRCCARSGRRSTPPPRTSSSPARAAAARRPTSSSELGAPLVFLGAGLPTDRIHSPNERVLLPMLDRGAEAAAHLWRELATLPRR